MNPSQVAHEHMPMAPSNDTDSQVRQLIAKSLPAFVGRLLEVGRGAGNIAAMVQPSRALAAHAIETASCAADTPGAVLGGVDPGHDLSKDSFHCICLGTLDDLDDASRTLRALLPYLDPNGRFLISVPNPRYWRRRIGGAAAPSELDRLTAMLGPLGLVPYITWRADDANVHRGPFDGCRGVDIGGQVFGVEDEQEYHDLFTLEFIVWLTRAGYDPVAHARDLLAQGRSSAAYEILVQIPDAYTRDPHVAADAAAEKLLCLLVMDRKQGERERLARFAWAQMHFYDATSRVPGHPLAFECQERFWRLLGDNAMANRLRRIYHQLHPEERVTQGEVQPEARRPRIEFPSGHKPAIRRVLLLTRIVPDFGLDVLYDGLCTVLGDDHVTEYPWKGTLHGDPPQQPTHYPCLFNHPQSRATGEDIIARAGAAQFDVIMFGALDDCIDHEFLNQLAVAAPRIPWVLLDQRDEADDVRHDFHKSMPAVDQVAYFKREWLHCADWAPPVYALPFGYPDCHVPTDITGPRSRAVFWAGHPGAGMRRAYLDHIAKHLGVVFQETFTQDQYRRALIDSRIGLNFFGFGFDTVRYWELPAHGCMLLANRMPIRIPHDFEDGISAVFFEDLLDLKEKLLYYMSHPNEAEAIARAGHAHFLTYHTGSARARQLLQCLTPHLLTDRQVS